MDHFISVLVRIVVFLSRFASALSKTGLFEYRSFENPGNDHRLHVLLAGYNGARNTGSDVRVAEIARQITERLGKENIEISVMTMDEETIRCYFDAEVHLIHCNAIFFGDVFKACCANQVVILCEGSMLKSKFANALTLYSCEAAGIAKNQHKPCIAYGSEAGEMDAFVERAARRLCKDTYFIARTENSLGRVHEMGLAGHAGTDAAWGFDSTAFAGWADGQLKRSGWDGTSPLLGIAPINPFWWPVKPSLIKWLRAGIAGDHSLQFRLWYFFSWSKQREKQWEDYLDAIAVAVNGFAEKYSCHVVLFGMEQLDTDACIKLKDKLTAPVSAFFSSECDGYQMAALLRKLSLLVTSRYHAEVLSMDAMVPGIAVSMDERLDNIMQEMDLCRYQLMHADDANLSEKLVCALEYVQSHRQEIKDQMGDQLVRYRDKLDAMGDFLITWLSQVRSAEQNRGKQEK